MSLLELFNQSLKRFEDEKEPITLSLAVVIQKKIDDGLNEEFEEFYEWFRKKLLRCKRESIVLF
ncbi:hypothetical protein [Bacillus altitudinis]|uniref:hypothetical protein n=1 Tax=Bacillus altitudinis TaxID=293387 RepID=UPI0021167B23|nr:hypothetical protein [Bacillus altitudinis]UUH74534.1 hypothetical protein NP445_01245 [Bacillus altitudinis]